MDPLFPSHKKINFGRAHASKTDAKYIKGENFLHHSTINCIKTSEFSHNKKRLGGSSRAVTVLQYMDDPEIKIYQDKVIEEI